MVVGANEIEPSCSGIMYNTNLTFNSDGALLGAHRKLVPTYVEKLIWGNGDGSGYRVHDTAVGRTGYAPVRGEDEYSRYALLAQG
jgi:nitrilase